MGGDTLTFICIPTVSVEQIQVLAIIEAHRSWAGSPEALCDGLVSGFIQTISDNKMCLTLLTEWKLGRVEFA